ncbi:MAG: hypothetical protein ACLQJR_32580, partial [Stellaceae bacterium]
RGAVASMRPRRARLGCRQATLQDGELLDASMRPRRARLGCGEADARAPLPAQRFNEAEARAPRMQPPYKPLYTKAILLRFRPVAHGDGRNLPNSTRHRIDHVKELQDFNNIPRFERVQGFARHIAARKRPAGMKHV